MTKTSPPGSRSWLITGTGSGFGRAIAEAALDAGDRIVATSRRPEDLDEREGHARSTAFDPGRRT